MGKYNTLGIYLRQQRNERTKMSFDQIEELLGFSLPRSARVYRAWWAEDPRHVQAFDGWLSVGWKVAFINFDNQTVEFVKADGAEIHTHQEPTQIKELPRSSAAEFENSCREIMSQHYRKDLKPGAIGGVKKLFDFVSEDKSIVGDAKFYTMVRGQGLPPAKFSVIAEHVWLLEKIEAKHKFLVFGNDRRVPEEWLRRYGNLVGGVEFYFVDVDGKLEKLEVK